MSREPGFKRNEGPVEPTDFERAMAEWLADCPAAYALGPVERGKINDIIEKAVTSWNAD